VEAAGSRRDGGRRPRRDGERGRGRRGWRDLVVVVAAGGGDVGFRGGGRPARAQGPGSSGPTMRSLFTFQEVPMVRASPDAVPDWRLRRSLDRRPLHERSVGLICTVT